MFRAQRNARRLIMATWTFAALTLAACNSGGNLAGDPTIGATRAPAGSVPVGSPYTVSRSSPGLTPNPGSPSAPPAPSPKVSGSPKPSSSPSGLASSSQPVVPSASPKSI
jgi:hypothetical protein